MNRCVLVCVLLLASCAEAHADDVKFEVLTAEMTETCDVRVTIPGGVALTAHGIKANAEFVADGASAK